MPNADFTPSFNPSDIDTNYGSTGGDITVPTFHELKPFRFWCQKALPLVYDDSLSYYELLCKVVDYLNNMMTDLTTATGSMTEFAQQFVTNQQFLNQMAEELGDNTEALQTYINERMEDFTTAYEELQDYVNDYFTNLDVQNEINTKLNVMAQDGTLSMLLEPFTEDWLVEKTEQITTDLANQNQTLATQNQTIANQNSRLSVLEGRMDSFSTLPSGSTSANAELVDIRTNFLGETFGNAGDAVRASDLIASGYSSIPFVSTGAVDGYNLFNVERYKGGKIALILNSLVNSLVPLGFSPNIAATNNADGSNRTLIWNDNESSLEESMITISDVFNDYQETIINTYDNGYRLLVTFSIKENFNYSYLYVVSNYSISGAITPNFIVYGTNWSKTPVDPTLSVSGDAADAKATGDAIESVNDHLLTFGVNKNILGEYANVLYPVFIKAGIPFTVSRADGQSMASLAGVRIFAHGEDRAQLNYWGLDVNATQRTITYNSDIYFISVNSTTIKLQVEFGSQRTSYEKYTEPYAEFTKHAFRTYGNVTADNYTDLLPSKKLSDIPVNTITYISSNLDVSDRPEVGNLIVLTYVGYAGYNYARLQECYCTASKKVYRRYSADGSTWEAWFSDLTWSLHTYGNINTSNYSSMLPTLKLSDLPVNTITYIASDVAITDKPENNNNLLVRTYTGYTGLSYARYQECYCTYSKKLYHRFSSDGSTWDSWVWDNEVSLHTYANINASNYTSLLPQKTLASMPSNTMAYIAADVGVTDAPSTGSAMFVRTSSGYSGLAYAKYQECFILNSRQVYFRYSNDNSSWDKWQKLSETFTDALKDNYVQTVVDKPITLNSNTGLYIFGDSITTDTHGGFTWASLITTKLGCTEYNFGVGGSNFVSGGILSQVNGVSDWSNASVVIVAAGTNERLSGTVTPSVLRTAVQDVITAIKTNAPNAKIVFITPIRRTFYQLTEIVEISSCIMNVAMINHCSVISGGDIPVVLTADENDWMIGFDDDDNLHPNSDGKWVYATSVLNALL